MGQRARLFTTRADLRYSEGGMPCAARKARLKSAALENPQRAAMAAIGRAAKPGSARSRRQRSMRRCRVHPATVVVVFRGQMPVGHHSRHGVDRGAER